MRISDWSSDVCSSGLVEQLAVSQDQAQRLCADSFDLRMLLQQTEDFEQGPRLTLEDVVAAHFDVIAADLKARIQCDRFDARLRLDDRLLEQLQQHEIGRASCRERVCQYV